MRFKLFTVTMIFMTCSFFSFYLPAVSLEVTARFSHDNIFKPVKIAGAAGKIYVLDTADQSLKVISKDHGLINSIGRRGEGPGELKNATDFCLQNGKIYVLDSHKVEVFSLDTNKYLSTRRMKILSPMKLCVQRDNYYILSLAFQKGKKLIKKCSDNMVRGELDVVCSFLDCFPLKKGNLTYIYKNFGSLAFFKGKVYFAYLLSNEILEFSGHGELLQRFTIPISPIDIEKLKAEKKNQAMRLHLDRAVSLEFKQQGEALYLLANDEQGDSLIFRLKKGKFKEEYRVKEKIVSFDIVRNEIWAIGSMAGEEPEILVYRINEEST